MPDRTPLPKQEIPGWYIKFQSDILQQLPRPEDGMDKVTALRWDKDQRGLKQNLKSLVTPPKIELSDKRFSIIDTFDVFVPDSVNEMIEQMEVLGIGKSAKKIVLGQKLKVDLIIVHGNVSIADCVNFLNAEGALLLGVLGLTLILEEQARLAKKQMRNALGCRWTASLGEQNDVTTSGEEDCLVPGMVGPDYINYELQSKTKDELEKEGGILFLYCFRDAS